MSDFTTANSNFGPYKKNNNYAGIAHVNSFNLTYRDSTTHTSGNVPTYSNHTVVWTYGVPANEQLVPRLGFSGTWTLPKDKIKKDNRILLQTFFTGTNVYGWKPYNYSNSTRDQALARMESNSFPYTVVKDSQGRVIGDIYIQDNNSTEMALVLHVLNTYDNLESDPQISISLDNPFQSDLPSALAMSKYDISDGFDIQLFTNNKLYTFHERKFDSHNAPGYKGHSIMLEPEFETFGMQCSGDDLNRGTGVVPIDQYSFDKGVSKFLIKYTGTNLPTKITTALVKKYPTIVLPSNYLSNETNMGIADQNTHMTVKEVEKTDPNTLLNNTPDGSVNYYRDDDGSLIVAAKETPDQKKIDWNIMQKMVEESWTYAFATPSEKQRILDNTKHYFDLSGGATHYTQLRLEGAGADDAKAAIYTGTDLLGHADPLTVAKGANGTSANMEFLRYVNVEYYDEANLKKPIKNDSVTGNKNTKVNYKLAIPKGYILAQKQPTDSAYTWSNDKKSIDYQLAENQNTNTTHPIKIYLTHGLHTANDSSGVGSRIITYSGAPGVDKNNTTQKVQFTRVNTVDEVTGTVTYGTWKPTGNGQYPAKNSPIIPGYIASQKLVPAVDAHQGENLNIKITYSKAPQSAKLTVHDDTTNTDLNDYTENSTGLYQDKINFKTAPSTVEQELKDKGYTIVSDSFKDDPTYNADDSKNNFVIHVTHKIVPVTPDQPKTPTDIIPDTKQHYPTGVNTNDLNKDVQRSIFYKYEDNSQAEPTVIQKAKFSRTVKVDAVTQKIVDPGNWSTKDNYSEVATKSIDGYKPDKTRVDSATPSMTNNQDQTVVYHANDEDAAITYIDDTTGKVLKTDTQNAKYKKAIKFATDPNTQIQTYKDQGYVLISSDWKDGSTYQNDPARNKFTVHLKHGTSTVTPDKPKKTTDIIPGTKQHYPKGVDQNDLNQDQSRKITYQFSDTKKQAQDPVTQTVAFHRTATVDNVTGNTTYTDWTTSDQYPEVDTKSITGYTPDKPKVLATKPVINTNQDVQVNYNANDQSATITYIDDDNGGKAIKTDNTKGKFNQVINFATDPNTEVKDLQSKGYVEGKSNYTTGAKYNSDNSKNNFTIHFTHKKVNVNHDQPKKPTDIIPDTDQHYPEGVDTSDLNKDKTRTITYTYSDSKKEAQPNVVQKVTFHRNATVDAVTGQPTYTDWKTTDQYPAVRSKDITGYTPDKPEIAVATPQLDKNQDEHVTYNPNDETVKVIAQDPNGKTLDSTTINGKFGTDYHAKPLPVKGYHLIKEPANKDGKFTTSNKDIIFIYKPDRNTVPQQADGTPKPDTEPYPSDLTPGKRQNTLPETGTDNTTLSSALAIASLGVLLPMSAVLKTRKNK